MSAEQFTTVPGFKKYEFNGKILRNIKTKSIMGLKKKNNKYQLISDDGKNVDRTKEQIIELCKVVVPVQKIEVKTGFVKPQKIQSTIGEPKKKSTMFMVNLLFHQGKSQEEIKAELGISNKQYLDSQWHYANRGYKEKIEKHLAKQK